MEMSGERISGPVGGGGGAPTTSNDTPSFAGDADLASSLDDDVELEKSNILMLGPTGKPPLAVWQPD